MWESSPASSDWCTRAGSAAVPLDDNPEAPGYLPELAVQVLPLAHPQVVLVLPLAQLAELVGRSGIVPSQNRHSVISR